MKATKLRQILVPIDFSPQSLETLRFTKLLATRFRAKLHLVHVVTPPQSFPLRRAMLPFAFSKKEATASALKALKNVRAEFSLSPRSNRCTVRIGAPAEEISQTARELGVDLITIATRGYTGLKHAFLGSTTARVVRSAPSPVLVVREKEHQSASQRARRGRTPLQFKKILVPLDFSECSRVGLDYALGFAREFRANLVLFHSVIVHSYALSDEYTVLEVPNVIALEKEYAEEQMEKLRRELSKKSVEVETSTAVGSPVERIGEYVGANDVDLIITSTHGRSGLQRVLIGSTAEQIVRYATCPVLVVPNRSSLSKTGKLK
jgi:nucleotide-binding universal stress UspA family protein